MMRYNGQVMTDGKYAEVKQAEELQEWESRSILTKLNNYYFDEDKVTLSDALWFYGLTGLILAVGIITFILLIFF